MRHASYAAESGDLVPPPEKNALTREPLRGGLPPSGAACHMGIRVLSATSDPPSGGTASADWTFVFARPGCNKGVPRGTGGEGGGAVQGLTAGGVAGAGGWSARLPDFWRGGAFGFGGMYSRSSAARWVASPAAPCEERARIERGVNLRGCVQR